MLGSRWISAPKVLNPFTTRASGSAAASAAATEPSGGGASTGPSFHSTGLVQSISTLRFRLPAACAAATAAVAGTHKNTTSQPSAASPTGTATALPPQRPSSVATSLPGLTPSRTA